MNQHKTLTCAAAELKLVSDWFENHPMTAVGAFEAKTHLPKLLEQVRQGASFTITRHGHPIAELIPVRRSDEEQVRAAIEALKSFQRLHRLDGLSVREMIEDGRRN